MEQNCSPYENFARIYDQIMAGVDYEAWADYVITLLNQSNKKPASVIDLACGTGSSTLPFARRGFKTAGVDLSPAMLEVARGKAERERLAVTWHEQDLRSLVLPEKYDLALLFQDGLNYLLSESDLSTAFKKIHATLNPGSLFIFDLTRPRLRPAGSREAVNWADLEEFVLIWESSFDDPENLWSIKLTAFVKNDTGLYHKFVEEHREKDYNPELITKLLQDCGFEVLHLYPSFKFGKREGSEQKLTFVAGKHEP